jgi:hypothetical protein
MKIVGLIVSAILTVGAFYLGADWWGKDITITRMTTLVLGASLMVGCYLVSVAIRLRRPLLKVGPLVPDPTANSNLFQLRVKNLGPGAVKPIVKITYLRDNRGGHLGRSSYAATEVYWRYIQNPNERPSLAENDEAYATILWVMEQASESPVPALHAISTEPIRLWETPISLQDQPSVRIKLTASYEGRGRRYAPLVWERSYILIPDRSQQLKYKIKRVRIWSKFWH